MGRQKNDFFSVCNVHHLAASAFSRAEESLATMHSRDFTLIFLPFIMPLTYQEPSFQSLIISFNSIIIFY